MAGTTCYTFGYQVAVFYLFSLLLYSMALFLIRLYFTSLLNHSFRWQSSLFYSVCILPLFFATKFNSTLPDFSVLILPLFCATQLDGTLLDFSVVCYLSSVPLNPLLLPRESPPGSQFGSVFNAFCPITTTNHHHLSPTLPLARPPPLPSPPLPPPPHHRRHHHPHHRSCRIYEAGAEMAAAAKEK